MSQFSQSDPFVPPPGESSHSACLIVALIVAAVVAVMVVLLAVVVFSLMGSMEAVDPGGEAVPGVGKKLPALGLQPLDPDERPVTLADLEGKVVLLNFWGTWCPPCRVELPHIVKIGRQYADRDDFRLLAVSCGRGVNEDVKELRANTQAFLDQLNVKLPTYVDHGAVTRQAVDQAAGFQGYPTTIVLDRTGTIRGVWTGYGIGMEHEIESLIEKVLDEPGQEE